MDRSGLQRLIPIILVLIIVAVSIAALVSLGRAIFSGGSQTAPVDVGKEALTSTLADRSVKMTVRGPIVATENFHSYTITVTPSMRNMTTYTGYVGSQVDNDQLPNSVKAYEEFTHALDRLNLMDGRTLDDAANNELGACASGTLYEFEVMQGSESIKKLWSTTCKSAQGSLKASASAASRLFQLQIPDYSKLSSKIRLTR
jgi:hypothetical protein